MPHFLQRTIEKAKYMIQIDDFAKVQLKVGTVISAEEIEGSDKLLKLQVDFGLKKNEATEVDNESSKQPVGEEDEVISTESADSIPNPGEASQDDNVNEIRQILSGIKTWYKPEDLIGKQFIFVYNLAPRKMMGLESQGMIMCADGEKPVPLVPQEKVENGAKIR
jgi:methionyl-tRNA synthetase